MDATAFGPQVHAIHRYIPGIPVGELARKTAAGATVRRLSPAPDARTALTFALAALADAGTRGPAFLLASGDASELHLVTDPDAACTAFLPVSPRFFTLRWVEPSTWTENEEVLPRRYELTFDLSDVKGQEPCSWGKYFATQPPLKDMRYYLSWPNGSCLGGPEYIYLHAEEGITLDVMVDHARSLPSEPTEYSQAERYTEAVFEGYAVILRAGSDSTR